MEQEEILAVLYNIDKKGDFSLTYITSLKEYYLIKQEL